MTHSPRITTSKPMFYNCGICGYYHLTSYDGDCHNDDARWSAGELDDKHGPDGWAEVDPVGVV